MKSPIWKLEEILELPEFGGKVGWFYGFVWYEGKLQWGEIYPGLGFSRGFHIWFEEEEQKIRCALLAIKRIVKDTYWAMDARNILEMKKRGESD